MSLFLRQIARYAAQKLTSDTRAREKAANAARVVVGEAKQITPLDTGALAVVIGRLGRDFARPDMKKIVRTSARETADSIAEIILDGLVATRAS